MSKFLFKIYLIPYIIYKSVKEINFQLYLTDKQYKVAWFVFFTSNFKKEWANV